MRDNAELSVFFGLRPWSDGWIRKTEWMEPIKLPPTSSTKLWGWLADGLMCETCRRYRRGLALVLLIAFALWLSGRWG
jgi:hypothetical protein